MQCSSFGSFPRTVLDCHSTVGPGIASSAGHQSKVIRNVTMVVLTKTRALNLETGAPDTCTSSPLGDPHTGVWQRKYKDGNFQGVWGEGNLWFKKKKNDTHHCGDVGIEHKDDAHRSLVLGNIP